MQSGINSTQGSTSYNTSYQYDAVGRLTSAYISDGKPRWVTCQIDENGQIIKRDETRPSNAPSSQTGSAHEVWYRFGGHEMGYICNNGTLDTDYSTSIAAGQSLVQAGRGERDHRQPG